jgi:phosphoribosylformylglycinamidine synthase
MATIAFKREGDAIVLIGETTGHLGQSVYLREIEGKEEGAAPPVDLVVEKKNGDFVRALVEAGRADTVHDISDGGLLVAIAEMALAGNIGAVLAPGTIPILFGEDQARYVLAAPCEAAERIVSEAKQAGVAAILLGAVRGDKIAVEGSGEIALDRLRKAHEAWFPSMMTGEL